jgi:hypothetical protein
MKELLPIASAAMKISSNRKRWISSSSTTLKSHIRNAWKSQGINAWTAIGILFMTNLLR